MFEPSYSMMIGAEELAKSIYSLVCTIASLQNPDIQHDPWDNLAIEKQQPWLIVATKGPGKLERCEGLPLKEVAFQIFLLQSGAELAEAQDVWDHVLSASYKLMWEAIARHIFTLMDADDASPTESELMYAKWYHRKAADLPHILTAN